MKKIMNGAEEHRLERVSVGQRVRHFRQRKNGTYHYGTVTDDRYAPRWCKVKWDESPEGSVMICVLLDGNVSNPQETPANQEMACLRDCAVVYAKNWKP